jgi:hypothetical protein
MKQKKEREMYEKMADEGIDNLKQGAKTVGKYGVATPFFKAQFLTIFKL